MALLVAVVLLGIGGGMSGLAWRDSQRDPDTATAVPLGTTGGAVALGGLAVLAGGWDVIGQVATVVSVIVLVVGLVVTVLRRSEC